MNKNILIVLGGGILIAVLVAVLVQATLSGDAPEVQVKEEERVEILVAAIDLRPGHKLEEGDMRWQSWPKSGVFEGAIIRKDDQAADEILSGRLAREIGKDEPATEAIILKTSANNLAASLEKGKRAIAIGVKANTMAGGFVTPGDYVDIMLTYKASIDALDPATEEIIGQNIDRFAVETILENIKVLAVDQAVSKPEESVKVGRTVTLEVSLKQAEELVLAAEMGDLTLALRGLGDEQKIEQRWPVVTDQRITTITEDIYREINKMKGGQSAESNTTGVNSDVVRIYSGSDIQDVSSR
jgi:pilus assembly protein CpaB